MVAGDSKVVLDWFVDKTKLEILSLNSWKTKILILRGHFTGIKSMHVHRQFNYEADSLSKKDLTSPIGWLHFEESYMGSVINADRLYIF
jgi:hypothetical protein